MRGICRTVCPSRVSGTLNGAGSTSAQRGAGVAAHVVIHGCAPAALAAPRGAVAARANIPAARHVDDRSRRRGSLDVQKRLKEVMAFHPLGSIFILRTCRALRRKYPGFLWMISVAQVRCPSFSVRASRTKVASLLFQREQPIFQPSAPKGLPLRGNKRPRFAGWVSQDTFVSRGARIRGGSGSRSFPQTWPGPLHSVTGSSAGPGTTGTAYNLSA